LRRMSMISGTLTVTSPRPSGDSMGIM
jgi:hypothetical protein